MIREIIHIGVTVKDIERSIEFYRDILGLKLKGRLLMKGKETDILFGAEDLEVKVAYLNGSDDLKCPPVELLEFSEKTEISQSHLQKTSISEICFKVDDIDSEYERLKNLGVEFISEPQEFDFIEYGFGKSKAVYFKDPDGVILELIQEIN
ncbi:MAG: VOC family protein [Tissierellia bacterium]|nr:VOC family protein [Tissierellia bacterium]